MGAWGVKATESDYGLDLLALIETRCLQPRNFEQFSFSEVMDFIKDHIMEQIKYANRGASKKQLDTYIEAAYPYRYEEAVVLVSELLADYFRHGKIGIDVYEKGRDKPLRREVTNVIYTPDELRGLLADLQAVIEPDSDSYYSWEESGYLHEWASHVQTLCDCLQNQIDGKNG